MIPWKILIVDDEEGIHGITRMIFRDYEFEQRPIELISAMSSAEAQRQVELHPDIALILLDVVMETENAGLQLVETIRHQMNNTDVRIILRTGHPGYAPEAQVIIDYDINDYLSKAELSASRLLTSVIVALRSYRDIQGAKEQQPEAIRPGSRNNDGLLPEVTQALQQHLTPALKQSQRLHKLELNPVATDLAKDLHAHQQRLRNTLTLCQTEQLPPVKHQTISLSELMNKVLQSYLPQSRLEGWILDYRLSDELPQRITSDPVRLELMVVSMLELALIQSNGADLIISLTKETASKTAPGSLEKRLQIQITLSDGQPVCNQKPWAEQIRQSLKVLSAQLDGHFNEIDEGGRLYCHIPA